MYIRNTKYLFIVPFCSVAHSRRPPVPGSKGYFSAFSPCSSCSSVGRSPSSSYPPRPPRSSGPAYRSPSRIACTCCSFFVHFKHYRPTHRWAGHAPSLKSFYTRSVEFSRFGIFGSLSRPCTLSRWFTSHPMNPTHAHPSSPRSRLNSVATILDHRFHPPQLTPIRSASFFRVCRPASLSSGSPPLVHHSDSLGLHSPPGLQQWLATLSL